MSADGELFCGTTGCSHSYAIHLTADRINPIPGAAQSCTAAECACRDWQDPKPVVEVAAALIARAGRILLTQRPAHKTFPFAWECPGGKRELGERYQDTIKRELKEELDLEVVSVSSVPLWMGSINVNSPVTILFFITGIRGDPRPLEGQGFGWFTAEEMLAVVMTPGNMAAMPALPHVAKIVFPS